MKTTAYILVILLLFSACRKKKVDPPPSKQCNYALIAFKQIGKDSLQMIGVDTNTGESIYSLYNFIHLYSGMGAFNINEKNYYAFQRDALGKIYVCRYNWITNKIDKLAYSGALDTLSHPYTAAIVYNKYSEKYYYQYSDWLDLYEFKLFELDINDNKCTDIEIIFTPRLDGMSSLFINESNGEVCFFARYNFYKYDYRSNTTMSIPYSGIKPSNLVYNPNDSMFYGILRYGVSPDKFCKMSPETGSVTVIETLTSQPNDNNFNGTIDICKNQYIIRKGGYIGGYETDTNINIYWLDIKTGAVVKHINTVDSYINLFSYNTNL